MEASQRVLFRDADFNISSKFIVEVNETNNVIALYPSQIPECRVWQFSTRSWVRNQVAPEVQVRKTA